MTSPADASAAGYDVGAVVAAALQADPGIGSEQARELAVACWRHLRAMGELDAPELARRCLAEQPGDASGAAVVARAAVDFCASRGVDPWAS